MDSNGLVGVSTQIDAFKQTRDLFKFIGGSRAFVFGFRSGRSLGS